jgi:exosortase/archaeosortase family protein
LSAPLCKPSGVGLFVKTNESGGFKVRDRHILMAFAGVFLIVLCLARLMIGGAGLSGVFVLDQVGGGIGLGEWLAMAALFSTILQVGDETVLSRGELLVIAAASLFFAVPIFAAASIPMTVVGLLFLRRRDARLSSIGQLLLALVFYEWLGPILFILAAPFVLTAETTVVQALLSLFGDFTRDNLILKAPNGHGIRIEIPCSAFHNLSFATLVWISLIKLEKLEMKRFHWWILAALVAATVSLNTTRIAFMAQSRSMYDYWHDGPGKTIVSLTMLAMMLGIFEGARLIVARDKRHA